MKTLIAKNSWLGINGSRLDASFHLSDGRLAKIKLERCPYEVVSLHEVTRDIFNGARFKRYYVQKKDKGIPFMGSSDMMKSDITGLKLISKRLTKNIDDLYIKKDWILVSCSGTIGNTVYTNDDYHNKTASQHIMRIIANGKLPSGYLYAYLSSKFGYSLLTQGTYGAVIQHIEPQHINDLPIPILPNLKQQQIHNLILSAAKLRVEANKFLEDVVEYFDMKYGIKDISNTFSKSINDLGFSWAAYNNNLECDKVESKLGESITIRDVATKCFAPPMFKHIYLDKDNGHPFLTGAELTKFIKKYYRWLSPRGLKNIEDYKVKKGTLLLYKSGTTDGGILGNVFITDDILHNACLSDHVIRIFTDDIKMSYWIFAFLKSSAGVRLLKKTATGSMIPFITPERLLDIKFPKPDDNFNWIADKIENYISKSVDSQ